MESHSEPRQASGNQVVVNINGTLPETGTVLLQAAYDTAFLKERLIEYLARSFEELSNPMDILAAQKILHIQANKVPELVIKNSSGNNVYDFESNQRIDELIALLAICSSTNQSIKNRGASTVLVPAWQRPKQGAVMNEFSGKESWDGFMHEYVALDTENPPAGVSLVPVEIKSLMINPNKEKYTSLNDLLEKKSPQFTKHFQAEGSFCAIVVLPYAMGSRTKLPFDLKKATNTVNNHVTPGAMGCLLFFGFDDRHDETTEISVQCHFVSKKPLIGSKDEVDSVELYELKFGSFKHKN